MFIMNWDEPGVKAFVQWFEHAVFGDADPAATIDTTPSTSNHTQEAFNEAIFTQWAQGATRMPAIVATVATPAPAQAPALVTSFTPSLTATTSAINAGVLTTAIPTAAIPISAQSTSSATSSRSAAARRSKAIPAPRMSPFADEETEEIEAVEEDLGALHIVDEPSRTKRGSSKSNVAVPARGTSRKTRSRT